MYFYPDVHYDKISYTIKLIADMDMWKFEYGDDTKAFCEYLSQYDIDNDVSELEKCIIVSDSDYGVSTNIKIGLGKQLVLYKQARIKKLYKKGHIQDFYGHNCFMCNSPMFQCDLAQYSFDKDDGTEIALIYHIVFNGKEWVTTYAIYSRGEVDVSEIAKRYGGGGHHNASGFEESTAQSIKPPY